MESGSHYLKLLGACEIHGPDGRPMEISRGKPLALLAHVALSSDPPSRDALASLLWSGSTRDRARGSVRQALWQLRQGFGERLFEEDDPVTLAAGSIVTDVERLHDHLSAGEIEEALRLWDGPPLVGIQVSGEPGWERWVDELRRDLERRLGAALADRGNGEREAGAGTQATQWLEWALEVQPHRLQHHLDLAEAHLELRNFDEAGRTLSNARRQFDDPAALDQLRSAEKRLSEVRRGTVLTESKAPLELRLHFTGRGEAFASLARQWNQARAGDTGTGLVLGEAGIGKTRLAEEIALMARSSGGRVVQVKAEDFERPIEWALLGELVEELLELSGAAGISPASEEILEAVVPSLLGSARPRREHSDPRALPRPHTRPSAALSDALQDLLAAVAEDAPLLVILDDLQWADAESRAVLTRAVTRLAGEPVLFIVTSRTGRGDVSPRMQKTLDLLSQGGRATRIELAPLTTDEIRTLLERTLTAPDRPETKRVLERVVRTSRGNPLFILELLKVLRDEGILQEDEDGTWTLVPEQVPAELPLPASLREIIDRQLGNLSEEASVVAAHLARTRRPASPRLVGARAGLSQDALTDGVKELVSRRMVHWESGEKLAFAHDELRAAAARRHQLHVGLTAGGGAQWSLFRTAVVASLLLLLVGAASYTFTGGTLTSAPSLGDGPLLIRMGDDSTLQARAPVGSPVGGWQMTRIDDEAGDSEHARRDSDTLRDRSQPSLDASRAASTPPPGGRRPILALDSSRRSSTPLLQLASPGEIRRLEVFHQGGEDGSSDSALVLRPDGGLVDARGWERIHAASWCGRTPPSLLLSVQEGGTTRLLVWHPETGAVSSLAPPGMPGSLIACSPDGNFAAAVTASEGRLGVHLLNLISGTSSRLPLEEAYEITGLEWHPDEPAPVATTVEITDPSDVELDWGERRTLAARVVHSDSTHSAEGIEWTSLNPGVASVAEGGAVTANRPGRTWLVASFDGWLADSVAVVVRETDRSPRILLWDPVPPLGDDLWIAEPAVDAPRPGSGPSRREPPPTENDTASSSGWRSVDGFSLPAGGTFEVEFTLREGGTPLQACLLLADPASFSDAAESQDAGLLASRAPGAPELCLLLRSHEGGSGEAPSKLGALHFHRSFPPVTFEISDPTAGPSRSWHHLAMALLPDGTGVLHLNGVEVARTPIRLPLESDGRWYVLLQGMQPRLEGVSRSRDFRNVLLWPDVRF